MKKLCILIAIVSLIGCAGFQLKQQQDQSQINIALAKTVVQYAAIKVTRQNPQLIHSIEDELGIVRDMLGKGISVATVKDYATLRVSNSDLLFEDKILLINLIDIAASSVIEVSNKEQLDQVKMAAQVLDWITEALSLMEVPK